MISAEEREVVYDLLTNFYVEFFITPLEDDMHKEFIEKLELMFHNALEDQKTEVIEEIVNTLESALFKQTEVRLTPRKLDILFECSFVKEFNNSLPVRPYAQTLSEGLPFVQNEIVNTLRGLKMTAIKLMISSEDFAPISEAVVRGVHQYQKGFQIEAESTAIQLETALKTIKKLKQKLKERDSVIANLEEEIQIYEKRGEYEKSLSKSSSQSQGASPDVPIITTPKQPSTSRSRIPLETEADEVHSGSKSARTKTTTEQSTRERKSKKNESATSESKSFILGVEES